MIFLICGQTARNVFNSYSSRTSVNAYINDMRINTHMTWGSIHMTWGSMYVSLNCGKKQRGNVFNSNQEVLNNAYISNLRINIWMTWGSKNEWHEDQYMNDMRINTCLFSSRKKKHEIRSTPMKRHSLDVIGGVVCSDGLLPPIGQMLR